MRGSDIGDDADVLSDVGLLLRVNQMHSIILFLILWVKYNFIFLANLGLATTLLSLLQYDVEGGSY